ncbi:hypothetical protein [Xanthomonas sp. NCPPB 2632]|uniref:hypothetical protein n=1 Tax=Xanthomonas sp. NCPPB 2632 TaxID=3240912 RepID=UPI003519BAD1
MTKSTHEERMLKRNGKRFAAAGSPTLGPAEGHKLALRGINKTVYAELRRHRRKWTSWVTSSGGGTAPAIRVGAERVMSDVPGATPTFVGIGLDEFVATRTLKKKALFKAITRRQAKNVFSVRSRTADLVWATTGHAEPIAGHTPSVKRQLVAGTTGAITSEHSTRDGLRAAAVDKTGADFASPAIFNDVAVMSQLATIKHMASPSTELKAIESRVQALATPRYTALTGTADIRQPAHFDSMVAHVQEERERKKWEVGAQMMADPRLRGMVPPVIKNYLTTTANIPGDARELFRSDLHTGRRVPINEALSSDTQDLSTHSLHQFSAMVKPTTRPRTLSDARILPPVIPMNTRGQ